MPLMIDVLQNIGTATMRKWTQAVRRAEATSPLQPDPTIDQPLVSLLAQAKSECDRLVVALNSDESVRDLAYARMQDCGLR